MQSSAKWCSTVKQSIFDPWPSSYLSSFDLVHQRYCLAVVKPEAAVAPVAGLFSCVRPGGWIQLIEVDLTKWRSEGDEHKAFKRMKDFVVKAFDEANLSPATGYYAKGCEKDPVWAVKGRASILSMLDMYRDIASKVPNYFFTLDGFESLRTAV
ncbi:MAG: hypothetical protein M1820_004574 [Bogoriella megaspora]|nr:MAG: hypothetical protein M1820_004574 [Bogoriella megaspora]